MLMSQSRPRRLHESFDYFRKTALAYGAGGIYNALKTSPRVCGRRKNTGRAISFASAQKMLLGETVLLLGYSSARSAGSSCSVSLMSVQCPLTSPAHTHDVHVPDQTAGLTSRCTAFCLCFAGRPALHARRCFIDDVSSSRDRSSYRPGDSV